MIFSRQGGFFSKNSLLFMTVSCTYFVMSLYLQQKEVGSMNSLKIAIIGQSAFAVDVMQKLMLHGHNIVGVFTIPDKGKREDPLGKFCHKITNKIKTLLMCKLIIFVN